MFFSLIVEVEYGVFITRLLSSFISCIFSSLVMAK